MHPASLRLQYAAEMDDRKGLRTRQVPKDDLFYYYGTEEYWFFLPAFEATKYENQTIIIFFREENAFCNLHVNLWKPQTKLTAGQVRLRNSAEILVLGLTCVPRFEYAPCQCRFA